MSSDSPRATYMREWRKSPEGKESLRRQKDRERARERAHRRLEQLHPVLFEILFQEELKRSG